ncbi:unnamed protein product [Sphagnum compactum]
MADQGGPEYGDSPPPPPAARRGGDYFDAQQSGVDSYADRAANGDRKREHSSHEPKREREKTREKDRGDRDRDRDHRPRDDRDRDRDRGDRDRGGHRSYDHERWSRDPDHGRDRRDKSNSNSLGRFRDRSRSQSPSESQSLERRSKRTSGFDMAPPGAVVVPGAVTGQIPGMPQPMPGVFPGMFPFNLMVQFGGLGGIPALAMTQQATRHARRVYVGGLPSVANEQTIATYFSQVMAAVGANTAGPGDAVVNVYINQEKKFAFVEMRTVEEASNAMALDGIIFEGVSVRVRRPSDYNPSMAATLGPSQPSPHLNLAAVGLTPGAAGGTDGPDRVFVGGLPYYLTEVQIKELLESFGPLRGFDLVKDRDTGNSKGYGFCVYQDPAVTDVAIAALNGLKMGDKTLSVRRASASGQPKPDQANVFAQAQHHLAIQVISMGNDLSDPLETPTKVIALTQVVSADELKDDEEYKEILEDMREECGKFGNLVELVIPRPGPTGDEVPGIGKVFVEYSDTSGSMKAKSSLHGRMFGGHAVVAVYYSEEAFQNGDYGG